MHCIVRAREHHGLTQTELAGRLGIGQAHLSAIERGAKTPSLSLLQRLCEELNLSPEERLEAAGLAQKQAA